MNSNKPQDGSESKEIKRKKQINNKTLKMRKRGKNEFFYYVIRVFKELFFGIRIDRINTVPRGVSSLQE